MAIRRIKVPVKITWQVTCSCGRKFTVSKGSTHRCACGNTYRF